MPFENSPSVRWGILGCGDVTEIKSGPALENVARSCLVSVMRRDAEKAADYAKRHKVPRWTSDANSLIADPNLTAIYIATPPDTHADYAIRALQAGKNVLVEKPMALNPDECDAIEAAVHETGGKLSVAYYRRALPRFEKLRQIIQNGTIGAPRLIEVRQFMHSDDRPAQSWKIDPAIGGGGSFVDMQSHTLDWLTYVFGMPAVTKGLKKRQGDLHAAEDLVTYLLDFGTFATVGMCAYAIAARQEGVTIHGEKGSASMGFFRPSVVTLTLDGAEQQIELSDPPHVHQPFIERVVAYFLDDAPNPCNAKDGRRSTDLVGEIFAGALVKQDFHIGPVDIWIVREMVDALAIVELEETADTKNPLSLLEMMHDVRKKLNVWHRACERNKPVMQNHANFEKQKFREKWWS